MYIDSVNSNNGDYAICGFNNVLICSSLETDQNKVVNFPIGYTTDSNMSFKVVFVNGYTSADNVSYMTLNDTSTPQNNIPVVVNQYGTLIPLPIHEITESGITSYKSLQANTILELYYTSDYDGNGNPAYVVIGNPIVLSSSNYTIYADSQIGNDVIGTIKSQSLIEIPYGWLECNGQAISRTKYCVLFNKFNNQLYDDDPTHTLLSRYGVGDGSTTFNLPDYREVVLVGIGSNGTDSITTHDEYTLGEFKDDQIQNHTHTYKYPNAHPGGEGQSNTYAWYSSSGQTENNGTTGRFGTTTHGKQKGINYLIKVL